MMRAQVCLLLSILLFVAFAEPHGNTSEPLVHVCTHDHIMREAAKNFPEHFQPRVDILSRRRKRNVQQAGPWGKLRVKWDFSLLDKSAEANFLMNTLLPKAGERLSELLLVQNIQGKLKLNRRCAKVWTSGPNNGKCAEFETKSICAPDTFEIPSSYFTTGVDGADLLIFAKLGDLTNQVANAHGCLVEFGTGSRPVAGRIIFDRSKLKAVSLDSVAGQYILYIALHELTHVLGFSESMYKEFRAADGKPYAQVVKGKTVVTPKVREQAKKYFNCPTAEGADLEDGGNSGSKGSHWEARHFKGEYMIAAPDLVGNVVSPLTIALLEDSGWYKGTYTKTAFPAWGLNKGCSFLTHQCLEGGVVKTPSLYCTDASKQSACVPGGAARAFCQQGDQFMDSCRYWGTYQDKGNVHSCAEAATFYSGESWGETYGPQSKCFLSTLFSQNNKLLQRFNPQGSGCYKTECKGGKLLVYIAGKPYDCTAAKDIDIPGYSGKLTCPGFNALCS